MVTNVASGAMVQVSATERAAKGAIANPVTVTKSAMVGPDDTSVAVEFAAATCEVNGTADQTCALADGAWEVTASYASGSAQPVASPAITVTIDTTAPTISLASQDIALQVGAATNVMFAASENLVGFELADVRQTNPRVASLAGFAGSGTQFSATLTAHQAGTTVVSVATDQFTDIAGNASLAPRIPLVITARAGLEVPVPPADDLPAAVLVLENTTAATAERLSPAPA